MVERKNVDKVLWPDEGITKGELLDYLEVVGPRIVRDVEGRPLTVVRAPDGVGKQIFFQKNASKHTPEWIRTVTLPAYDGRKDVNYYVCDNVDTLMWLGNQAAIEFHVATARLPKLDRPDVLAFDLDPPDGRFDLAVEAANIFTGLLQDEGLRPAAKTTGGKGLHLLVPIERRCDAETVMGAAERIAARAIEAAPDKLTQEFKKADRAGRLFIDIGRNTPGATIVAPYSPRTRAGAPVSFPVAIDGLDDVEPERFTIRTAPGLLDSPGVAEWDETMAHAQRLPASLTR